MFRNTQTNSGTVSNNNALNSNVSNNNSIYNYTTDINPIVITNQKTNDGIFEFNKDFLDSGMLMRGKCIDVRTKKDLGTVEENFHLLFPGRTFPGKITPVKGGKDLEASEKEISSDFPSKDTSIGSSPDNSFDGCSLSNSSDGFDSSGVISDGDTKNIRVRTELSESGSILSVRDFSGENFEGLRIVSIAIQRAASAGANISVMAEAIVSGYIDPSSVMVLDNLRALRATNVGAQSLTPLVGKQIEHTEGSIIVRVGAYVKEMSHKNFFSFSLILSTAVAGGMVYGFFTRSTPSSTVISEHAVKIIEHLPSANPGSHLVSVSRSR